MERKLLLFICIGISFIMPVYPFLHESSHALAILYFHGRIKQFYLFPQAFVLVDPTSITKDQLWWIALAGPILPCLLSFLPYGKKFVFWSLGFFVRAFGAFACFANMTLLFLSYFGYDDGREDIIRCMHIHERKEICIVLFFILCVVQILLIAFSLRYFPKAGDES